MNKTVVENRLNTEEKENKMEAILPIFKQATFINHHSGIRGKITMTHSFGNIRPASVKALQILKSKFS